MWPLLKFIFKLNLIILNRSYIFCFKLQDCIINVLRSLLPSQHLCPLYSTTASGKPVLLVSFLSFQCFWFSFCKYKHIYIYYVKDSIQYILFCTFLVFHSVYPQDLSVLEYRYFPVSSGCIVSHYLGSIIGFSARPLFLGIGLFPVFRYYK